MFSLSSRNFHWGQGSTPSPSAKKSMAFVSPSLLLFQLRYPCGRTWECRVIIYLIAVCLHILLPLIQTHGLDGYFQKVSYTYIVSYEFVEFIYFKHLRQTNLSFSGHQSKAKLVDLRFRFQGNKAKKWQVFLSLTVGLSWMITVKKPSMEGLWIFSKTTQFWQ